MSNHVDCGECPLISTGCEVGQCLRQQTLEADIRAAKVRAVSLFAQLVRQHGLQWRGDAGIPAKHWRLLAECAKVMDERDRRAALGLPQL